MIIERQITPFIVYGEDPVRRALEKITANQARIIFVVDVQGRLLGSLSDGDFRRWVATTSSLDLDTATSEVANADATSAADSSTPTQIRALFRPGVDHIPLMDAHGHVVAVAINRSDELHIGRHTVSDASPTLVIAEVGNNHQGDVAFAKQLVDLAKGAGADIVKFQLRDLSALYRQGSAETAGEDLGAQYTLDLLAKYNLTAEQLFEVFDYCAAVDIDVLCTPWDEPSVDRLLEYGLPALKVASADMTNHSLLHHMSRTGTPLIVSTGMSTEVEIRQTAALLQSTGVPHALLHCQSSYPAPYKDINLRYLKRLKEIGDCPVGYSGHERGYHVPIAAVALGARIIEKHFTTDRSFEGNDHKVSLLPDEFAEMVRGIRNVEEALGTTGPRTVSTGELMNRVNLAKSIVAAKPITQGDTITLDSVEIKSPGRGLQPNALSQLVGRVALHDFAAGDFFYATDLGDEAPRGRQFTFRRPWGIPVRYHDIDAMTADCTPDLLEFHFSYKDMDLDVDEVFAQYADGLPMSYATHAPELFAGDFLVDLASTDDEYWERSIAELQRVVDATRQMRKYFTKTVLDPVIVANLGGYRHDGFVPASERPAMYERMAAGLAQIDDDGVRLCPQTMPPFPWLMGGQSHHNLLVRPEEIVQFCETFGLRVCLDVSHSKLAANWLGISFADFTEQVAPYTDHLHLVDATGVDGEGSQVGDGEIDWPLLAKQLDQLAPQASFIPEIWQGHINGGEGFWTALTRLEQWF